MKIKTGIDITLEKVRMKSAREILRGRYLDLKVYSLLKKEWLNNK